MALLNVPNETPSISPSSETINSIKQTITNSTILKTEYDSLSNLYGNFFWNKATYQPAEDSRSITCIPSEKDNQLTGMIIVFYHDDHMDFSFINLSQVMTIIQNNEAVNDLEFIATILSLQNMLYYRYRFINQDLNTYILEYFETHQIGLRNVVYARDWVVTFEIDGEIVHSYADRTWSIRQCVGSGGFTGPIFTNGTPSSNGVFNVSPSNIDSSGWTIKTLVVEDNEEDIEEISECLDHSICNDLFNHINNISGDYTVSNCSNVTASELAIDILAELCDNNTGDNTGFSIEGTGNDSNIICDKEKFDEMWNTAVNEINSINSNEYIVEDSTLLNCPLLNCLYNKLSSQQTNNFICTYISSSFDDSNFEVVISVGEVSGGGESSYNSEMQHANLMLSIDNCSLENPNEIYLSAQILHEFVHIELFRQMVEAGLDPNTFEDYYSFWNSWTDWIYEVALEQGTNEVHHHVMIKYEEIIRPLAESLFLLFDGESNGLTIDHFMMSAANGLFYAMELHSSSDPNFNNLYGDFVNQYSGLSQELNNLKLSLGCE